MNPAAPREPDAVDEASARPAPGRPLPDRSRGPVRPLPTRAAHLADRNAEVDRRVRFRQRREQVEASRARHRRTERVGQAAILTAVATVAAVIGTQLLGPWGIALGLVAVGVVLAVEAGLGWLAARRGPEAWDWAAGRHRLIGTPATRVHELDRPAEQRGSSFFG